MSQSRPDLIVRGERVATVEGIRPAAVHIALGRIERVAGYDEPTGPAPVIDAGDAVVFPGLVDSHVHVNEPGRTDWEGFASATRAAAAGGVTTLVDMPLNSIPATTSVAALEAKRAAADAQCAVDVGFLGGVVPGNAGELRGLHYAGVLGFKCFLAPSGVAEFPPVSEPELRAALPVLAELSAVLMVHAELPHLLTQLAPGRASAPRHYSTWLRSRPEAAESEAVALLCSLADELGARVHIVHVSAAQSAAIIAAARRRRVRVTAETCPHYLTLHEGEIRDGATEFKCAPPIRDAANREQLWAALLRGDLDQVVSDHSPCPAALKHPDSGDFIAAWGGIASLELGLALVWTGARERGVPLERLTGWLCEGPARLVGLDSRKGRIAPGYDADLVVWRPEVEFTVNPLELRQRHPVTPYAGRRLAGRVEATYLRGEPAFRRGEPAGRPRGRLITRRARAP